MFLKEVLLVLLTENANVGATPKGNYSKEHTPRGNTPKGSALEECAPKASTHMRSARKGSTPREARLGGMLRTGSQVKHRNKPLGETFTFSKNNYSSKLIMKSNILMLFD